MNEGLTWSDPHPGVDPDTLLVLPTSRLRELREIAQRLGVSLDDVLDLMIRQMHRTTTAWEPEPDENPQPPMSGLAGLTGKEVLEALRSMGCNDDICVLDAVRESPETLEDEVIWLRHKHRRTSGE